MKDNGKMVFSMVLERSEIDKVFRNKEFGKMVRKLIDLIFFIIYFIV